MTDTDVLAERLDKHDEEIRDLKACISEIDRKLTTWVNPVIAAVISVLTGLIGALVGVLAVVANR